MTGTAIANACGTPANPNILTTPGFNDHNIVSIATLSGALFLRTDGLDCPSLGSDVGQWRVVGGSGIFKGATGNSTVVTRQTGGSGTSSDPITSFSTYTGTITLR